MRPPKQIAFLKSALKSTLRKKNKLKIKTRNYRNNTFFLVILTLHSSKTTCDRRKPIVDLASTSKNTMTKK